MPQAQGCPSITPEIFRRCTSSSSRTSSVSHYSFSDFRVICISPLEHTTYPHPPRANTILLGVYLHIDAPTLAASPRYSDATTTIHAMRHPDCTFSSGRSTFTCRADGMMRGRVAGASLSGSQRPVSTGQTGKSFLFPSRMFDSKPRCLS